MAARKRTDRRLRAADKHRRKVEALEREASGKKPLAEMTLGEVSRSKVNRKLLEATLRLRKKVEARETLTHDQFLYMRVKEAEFKGKLHETLEQIAEEEEIDLREAYTDYFFSPKAGDLAGYV
jgi:hypothetical protein